LIASQVELQITHRVSQAAGTRQSLGFICARHSLDGTQS
jgi:hypothetical protein